MDTDRMIPEGKYAATVTGTSVGYTGTGKPQVSVTFDVHLGADEFWRTRTWFGFLTEAAIDRTFESLSALGYDSDTMSLESLNPANPMDTPLAGREAQVVIRHEEYDGQVRDRIAFVNRAGGGGAFKIAADRALDAGTIAALDAQIRAKAGAARASGPRHQSPAPRAAQPKAAPQPAAPAAPKGGGIGFDDIPF